MKQAKARYEPQRLFQSNHRIPTRTHKFGAARARAWCEGQFWRVVLGGGVRRRVKADPRKASRLSVAETGLAQGPLLSDDG
jgi:hypothetical protein